MFSGEYQGGSFVDLMPSGSNPLAGWKVTAAQKVYDKDTKGYIHQSCGGGATRMQIPKDDKATLGLLQPFLVLQVNLPRSQALTLELGISDTTGTRRRLLFSSSFADVKATPLHCQVPINPLVRESWLNLVLSLNEMTPLLFRGAAYRQLDTLAISGGTCKIRRVFTLKEVCPSSIEEKDGSGLILPRGLELPLGIQVASQLLGSTSLSALMAGPGGLGTGRAGSALNGAIALTTARTSPAAKPSLTVHIDDDSSDEEADRGIRMLSGTSSSSGLQWAAGRATVGEQTPPASRLSRPTVKPTLAGGSGPSAAPSGVSFASGRRAISAQTVLREEATTTAAAVGSGAPQLRASADTLASEGGITSQRCGGAPPALSLGRGGPSSGTALIVGSAASGNPSLLGASPPYPRAVYSQRTQSGPARMCEDAVLSGMVDVPGTPTSAKHGRRSVVAMALAGRNIPTTICEAEPLKSSDESPQPAQGRAASPSRPGAACGGHRGSSLMKGPAGSPKAQGSWPSPGGKKDGPELESLLLVKASVDSSSDFSAARRDASAAAGAVSTSGGTPLPLISNMFSLMQSVSLPVGSVPRDRYAGQAASRPAPEPDDDPPASAPPVSQQQRPAAPPSHRRPAAPADHMSRPRMGIDGPSSSSTGVSAAAAGGDRGPKQPSQASQPCGSPSATTAAAASGKRALGTPPKQLPSGHSGGARAASPGKPGSRTILGTNSGGKGRPTGETASVGAVTPKAVTPSSRTRPLLPPAPLSAGQSACLAQTGALSQVVKGGAASATTGNRGGVAASATTGNRGPSPAKGRAQPQLPTGKTAPSSTSNPTAASRTSSLSLNPWSEEKHRDLIEQRRADVTRTVSNVNSVTAASEVEEDLDLNMWNGFGVDEDEMLLGSKHFHQGGNGRPLSLPGAPQPPVPSDSPRGPHVPSLAPIKTKPPPWIGPKGGLLEGIGSPTAMAVSSPPIKRVGPAVAAAGATQLPLRRHRPSHDLDDAVLLQQADDGPPAGGLSAAAHGAPSRYASKLGGGGGASGHYTNTTVDALLSVGAPASGTRNGGSGGGRFFDDDDDEDDALLTGRRGNGSPSGRGDSDFWGRSIDRMMPPMERLTTQGHQHLQRAFTPPIVPPSKVVQQQRAAAAAAAPQGPPQVLSLGGPNRGEEMVDLVYDPVLNCYYDQKTNKYYELKH